MHFYILFAGKQFCGYELRDESDRNGGLENEPSQLNPLRVTRVPFTGEGRSLRSSNEGKAVCQNTRPHLVLAHRTLQISSQTLTS